jgi:tripartite-type tricarboxylate transporter receptor subunit TctC
VHRGGKTRILSTSGATRSPLLPEVPTFAEAGLRDVQGTSWFAVFAPAKTSGAAIAQLDAAINKAIAARRWSRRAGSGGIEAQARAGRSSPRRADRDGSN